jgi:hypothetical protein
MNPDPLTNETLMTTDFASAEKNKFLQSTRHNKCTKTVFLVPGLPAQDVWMTDVSATDRRSVKAQLAGRGDFRATWWKLNCLLHRWFKPQVSLEQMMYAFHSRHHAMTLARLELMLDYESIYKAVRQGGAIDGIRCANMRARSGRPRQRSHASNDGV